MSLELLKQFSPSELMDYFNISKQTKVVQLMLDSISLALKNSSPR